MMEFIINIKIFAKILDVAIGKFSKNIAGRNRKNTTLGYECKN